MTDNPAAKRSSVSLLKFALRILISGGLLVFLALKIDLRAFLEVVSHARLDLLALVVVIMVAERFLAAYRWLVLLRGGGADANFGDLVRIVFASSFFGLFLPGGAIDALRVIGQTRKSNNLAFAFSSVLLDRLMGVFALAATTLIALLIADVRIDPAVTVWAAVVLGITLATYAASLSSSLRSFAERLLSPHWLAKPRDKFGKLMYCMDAMQRNRGAMLRSAALAFAFQSVRVLTVIVAALAIDVHLALSVHFALVPLIFFIMLLPISVGGFGTREAAFIYLYGAMGVPSETALTLSLLIYFTLLISGLPGAWIGHDAFGKAKPLPSAAA